MSLEDQALVSIVIPFYNVEKYLDRAIQSAISQTYHPIEIILVNDGSSDQSGQIAARYAKELEQVQLLTIPNGGPGHARNKGMELVNGAYLVFLDADDALEENMVEVMLKELKEQEVQGVICKFTLYDKHLQAFRKTGWGVETSQVVGDQAVIEMYNGRIASTIWAKMYESEIVKKIRFPKGLWFEDRPFAMEYFLKVDKIGFVDASLINIYSRETSITRQVITAKRIEDLHHIYEIEIGLVDQYQKGKDMEETIIHHHLRTFLESFFVLMLDRKEVDNQEELQELYLTYIQKFRNHIASRNYALSTKKEFLLRLLESPKWLPWSWSFFLISNIKRRTYKSISKLKLS